MKTLAKVFFFTLMLVCFVFLAASCGKQDLVLSGEATINHKVSLDTAQLIPLVIECIRDNPYYTDAQIERCVADKIAGLN